MMMLDLSTKCTLVWCSFH